jgi:hypothetical protein
MVAIGGQLVLAEFANNNSGKQAKLIERKAVIERNF